MTEYTARFLVDQQDPSVFNKSRPHITAAYLGHLDSPDTTLANIARLAQQHLSTTSQLFHATITNVVLVGPTQNLLAYAVTLQGPPLALAADLWNTLGQLEPWQTAAGTKKALFGNTPGPVQDSSDDDQTPTTYYQTHHITIGPNSPEGFANMQQYIGHDVRLMAFDVKQLGPYDACLTCSLRV